MEGSALLDPVRTQDEPLRPLMDARLRRQWAASEAMTRKRGGVTVVAQATGSSRTTIGPGMRGRRARTDLGIAEESCPSGPPTRGRHPGGGRRPSPVSDPPVVRDLEA